MADGDVLTIDSTQPGGSGTVAGETKFAWKPSSSGGIIAPSAWNAFKPLSQWIPVNVQLDGGPGATTWSESEGAGTTQAYGTFIFAYPEICPNFDPDAAGEVDSLGFYMEGPGDPTWIGIARSTLDSNGNPFPGAIVGKFIDAAGHGFDGDRCRSGGVAVSVDPGELIWICYQTNSAGGGNKGYRLSQTYRALFGTLITSPLAGGAAGQIGIRTDTQVTYDTTITTFPTSGTTYVLVGNNPITNTGGNTTRVPSMYVMFTQS